MHRVLLDLQYIRVLLLQDLLLLHVLFAGVFIVVFEVTEGLSFHYHLIIAKNIISPVSVVHSSQCMWVCLGQPFFAPPDFSIVIAGHFPQQYRPLLL